MEPTDDYAKHAALIDTDWVAKHLDEPDVRLVEVDVDWLAYDIGHIPGTVGWNWKIDLQHQPSRDIPGKKQWEKLLGRSGVTRNSTVILYGDNNNWFAAFAYWLFKLYGHDKVQIMNGGRALWLAEHRPMTDEHPRITATSYQAENPKPELRALRDDVMTAVDNATTDLVDVRSPTEYSGELLAPWDLPQEGAQRGGHVPGASNIPWESAVAKNGTFRSADELRSIYGAKGIDGDQPIITYCRIGERSAHTWFVLTELLGYPNVRNYDGSWAEWGSMIGVPIER